MIVKIEAITKLDSVRLNPYFEIVNSSRHVLFFQFSSELLVYACSEMCFRLKNRKLNN
jgi:hypothetical protein